MACRKVAAQVSKTWGASLLARTHVFTWLDHPCARTARPHTIHGLLQNCSLFGDVSHSTIACAATVRPASHPIVFCRAQSRRDTSLSNCVIATSATLVIANRQHFRRDLHLSLCRRCGQRTAQNSKIMREIARFVVVALRALQPYPRMLDDCLRRTLPGSNFKARRPTAAPRQPTALRPQ